MFSGSGRAVTERLPDLVTGKTLVYDGVTFGLNQNVACHWAETRICLEAVDTCESQAESLVCGRGVAMRSGGGGVAYIANIDEGSRVPTDAYSLGRHLLSAGLRRRRRHCSFGSGAGDGCSGCTRARAVAPSSYAEVEARARVRWVFVFGPANS